MPEHPERYRSHLFTLRLWIETLDGQHAELRGVALHVRTGARLTIRDWLALQAFLVEHVSGDGEPALQPWADDGPGANK